MVSILILNGWLVNEKSSEVRNETRKVSILVLNGWLVNSASGMSRKITIKSFNPCFKWMVG